MSKWMKLLGLLFFSMTILSCAFAAVSKPDINAIEFDILKVRTYNPEKIDLLTIAKESLEAMGIEVLSFNKKLNSVRSKPTQVQISGNCDCGKWNGQPVIGTANVTTEVHVYNDSETKSRVDISNQFVVIFTGRNLYGAATRVETYQCASTGKLENDFWILFDQLVEKE